MLSVGLTVGAFIVADPNSISDLVVAMKLILKFFHLLYSADSAWKYIPLVEVRGFDTLISSNGDYDA